MDILDIVYLQIKADMMIKNEENERDEGFSVMQVRFMNTQWESNKPVNKLIMNQRYFREVEFICKFRISK